jgi:hypothetical protein
MRDNTSDDPFEISDAYTMINYLKSMALATSNS